MNNVTISVLVVDDHQLFREGVAALLEEPDDIEVVGEASDGWEAVRLVQELHPDVVLMDLRMPGMNGIEAISLCRAKYDAVAIVVLTMLEDRDSVFAAMRAGACGYIVKGSDRETMVRSIRSAALGEVMFSAQVADRVLDAFRHSDGENIRVRPFPELTEREYDVLALIATGLTNVEAGQRLGLSPKTVANYLSQVFVKLQVNDRSRAIVKAHSAGVGAVPKEPPQQRQ